MGARVMISPVVEPKPNVLMSKAEGYCTGGFLNAFPSGQDGRNATSWVMTIGRAADWTSAEADPEIEFLFAVPQAVNTADELRTWLRATTIGDLPLAQRNALQTAMDAHAVSTIGFTLTTPLAKVVQRTMATLFAEDFAFGMSFRF